jgi:glycolate oxidase FAD binding subunit
MSLPAAFRSPKFHVFEGDSVTDSDVVTSEEQVAEAIRDAATARLTLEIAGSGSKRALGRPVQANGRLDLHGLSGITLYEPEELVLRAKAGTPLLEIETTLARHGQTLAFEPPDLAGLLGSAVVGQTIGGIVATNLSGPRRSTAGALRDHLLGVRAVNGRGELFKAGGRVVKNVTGYDLCKLLAGSFGTLAVLTEVTVKVLPAAETEATVIISGLSADQSVQVMSDVFSRAIGPSAGAWLPAPIAERTVSGGGSGDATCLRLEGFGPSVDVRRAQLLASVSKRAETRTLAGEDSRLLWRQIGHVQPFHGKAGQAVWKLSVRPSDAPQILARLSAIAGLEAFLDWGGGLIWLCLPCGDDGGAPLVRAALPGTGHAMLVAAPDAVRAAQPVFQPLEPGVARIEACLKAQFDPLAILNPHRREPPTHPAPGTG